jgi:hypothetical protein
MNVVKRIIFEVLFLVLFTLLMPWHFIYGIILYTVEIFRIYPREIYALAGRIVYGEDS